MVYGKNSWPACLFECADKLLYQFLGRNALVLAKAHTTGFNFSDSGPD
jgi:hypothetical protein